MLNSIHFQKESGELRGNPLIHQFFYLSLIFTVSYETLQVGYFKWLKLTLLEL